MATLARAFIAVLHAVSLSSCTSQRYLSRDSKTCVSHQLSRAKAGFLGNAMPAGDGTANQEARTTQTYKKPAEASSPSPSQAVVCQSDLCGCSGHFIREEPSGAWEASDVPESAASSATLHGTTVAVSAIREIEKHGQSVLGAMYRLEPRVLLDTDTFPSTFADRRSMLGSWRGMVTEAGAIAPCLARTGANWKQTSCQAECVMMQPSQAAQRPATT